MTDPDPMNSAGAAVTLPMIAGLRGSRNNVSVSGTLVGIVPQLATRGPAAERMRALAEKLDREGTVDDAELNEILGDQEVMYVVVGKWPPPTTVPPSAPPLSSSAQEVVEALRSRDVATMVVGKWPP